MIRIIKNPEPKEWTEYRVTPNTEYKSIPALRAALLDEQGFICAYCMRRIPHRDKNSNEDSRIDHIKCQSGHQDETLDYNNMVICCPGAINDDFHCDKRKGERDISFSPLDPYFMNTIKYSSNDGTIRSSNDQINSDINEVLNLNNKLLKKNRFEALQGVISALGKTEWTRGAVDKKIMEWETKHDGKFYEYCGIVIWFLNKKKKLL